jgi:hypothetical protein
VACWWALVTLVSGVNIAVWCVLYRQLGDTTYFHGWMTALAGNSEAGIARPSHVGGVAATPGTELMLLLSAAYVFGCAFRSFLPRADVQRICLFDTWLSSVTIGWSVATVAEVCFVVQWAIVLHQLGAMTGAGSTLNAAWAIVPLIVIAECFSWHAVLTRNYLSHAIENSIWAVAFFIIGVGLCRLLPEFGGMARIGFIVTIVGIAGYLAFLATIDVPMYLTQWRTEVANGSRFLSPLEGLRDASISRIVTRDVAEWRDEIPWVSLYFSAAVWSSLALGVCYSFEAYLAHFRTVTVVIMD